MPDFNQDSSSMKRNDNGPLLTESRFLVLEDLTDKRPILSTLMVDLQVPVKQIYFSASLSAIISQHYDFIILDGSISDCTGPGTVAELHRQFPATVIIVLLDSGQLQLAGEMLQVGAEDILIREELTALQLYKTILASKERLMSRNGKEHHKGAFVLHNPQALYDAIWDWNLLTNELSWGNGLAEVFGHEDPDTQITFSTWSKFVHSEDREEVLTSLHAAISGSDEEWEMQYRFLKADGSFAHVHDKGMVLRDSSGQGYRMIGTMEDITHAKQEEQRLKLMDSVIANSAEAVLIAAKDPDSKKDLSIIYANNAFCRLSGYAFEEVRGKNPMLLAGTEPNQAVIQKVEKALLQNEPCEFESLLYKKNGVSFWANNQLRPVTNDQGMVTHWLSNTVDITAQKKEASENELFADLSRELNRPGNAEWRMQRLLKRLCDHAGFVAGEWWLTGRDKRHLNRMAEYSKENEAQSATPNNRPTKMVLIGEGLQGKAWKTKTITTWVKGDPEDTSINDTHSSENPFEYACAIPIIFNETVVGVFRLLSDCAHNEHCHDSNIFMNLSNRLSAEIQRLKLEEELNRFFQITPDLLSIAGMNGYFQKINPAFFDILGYSEEELLSTPYKQLIHPEDRDQLTQLAENFFSESTTVNLDNRFIAKDGTIKWIAWTLTSLPEERIFYAVAKEITEKKRSEEALAKANKHLKAAQGIAKIGYWSHDMANDISEWSEEVYKIWERDPQTFKPNFERLLETIHPADKPAFLRSAEEAFPNKKYYDNEHRILTPDGNIKWIRERITLLRDDNGNPYKLEGIAQDITEEKRLKKERGRVLDSITDGFLAVNDQWEVTYWNTAAELMLGNRREDILGKVLWDEYAGAVDTPLYHECMRAMTERKPGNGEGYLPALDKWMEISTYPADAGLTIYLKDVTQSKLQEREISRIKSNREALINSTDDLVWSVDKEGKLVSANQPFKQTVAAMFNTEVKEGDPLVLPVKVEADKARWEGYYSKALAGEKFTITEEANFAGVTVYSLISFNPIFDEQGNCNGTACFSKDITEKMNHLHAIEEQNERLRNIAWTQSHVVRAPLARIMGLVDLLKVGNKFDTIDTEFTLANIMKSASELDQIVSAMVQEAENLNLHHSKKALPADTGNDKGHHPELNGNRLNVN